MAKVEFTKVTGRVHRYEMWRGSVMLGTVERESRKESRGWVERWFWTLRVDGRGMGDMDMTPHVTRTAAARALAEAYDARTDATPPAQPSALERVIATAAGMAGVREELVRSMLLPHLDSLVSGVRAETRRVDLAAIQRETCGADKCGHERCHGLRVGMTAVRAVVDP